MSEAINIPFGIGGWQLHRAPWLDRMLDRKIERIRYREARLFRLVRIVDESLTEIALLKERIETKVAARQVDLDNQIIAMVHAQEANARSIQNAKAIKRIETRLRKRAR